MSADKERNEEDVSEEENEDDEMEEISVSSTGSKLTSDITVPFATSSEAEIAYGSLSVDKEPKRGGVVRTMSVKDNILVIHFEASEARILRVSMNSFLDHLILVQKTIAQFGPPMA